MKRISVVFVLVSIGIIVGILLSNLIPSFYSFETRREKIIADLNSEIEKSVERGDYRCCIEPACTMCYLGDWIWDDGICRCDEMIAQGQDDKVCPQCRKGLEEGKCKYSEDEKCVIDLDKRT